MPRYSGPLISVGAADRYTREIVYDCGLIIFVAARQPPNVSGKLRGFCSRRDPESAPAPLIVVRTDDTNTVVGAWIDGHEMRLPK